MMEPVNAALLVYATLEGAIMSGRLKPRQRLVERSLEKEFGVSRTPIRDALRQLRHAGLVQTDGARGVVVRDVDVAEVFNLFAVRLPLEKLVIDTMGEVTAEAQARLDMTLAALDAAYDAHDFSLMVAHNTQFHQAMASLTGNDWLVRTLEQIRRQCYLIVQHGPVAERAGQKVSLAEHKRMARLAAAGDRQALTELTFEHVLRTPFFFLRRREMFDPTAQARSRALKAMADQLLRCPPVVLPAISAAGSSVVKLPQPAVQVADLRQKSSRSSRVGAKR